MVVIGAGGFAKELLQVLISGNYGYSEENLFFFDNVNDDIPDKLFDVYRILKSFEEAEEVFRTISPQYCIGVGVPVNRYKLSTRFKEIGGQLTTVISPNVIIGTFSVSIDKGVTIMHHTTVSSDVKIGEGTLVNLNCSVGHDVEIGKYCDISPGVEMGGHCKIGDFTTLGTGAIILPDVKIGRNAKIVAGSVVNNEVPDNALVVGVMPSRVVGNNPPVEP